MYRRTLEMMGFNLLTIQIPIFLFICNGFYTKKFYLQKNFFYEFDHKSPFAVKSEYG